MTRRFPNVLYIVDDQGAAYQPLWEPGVPCSAAMLRELCLDKGQSMQLLLNGRFGSSRAARQLGSGNRGGRVTNLRVRKRRASNDAFAPCCASDDSPPPILATLRIRVSNPRLAGPIPPRRIHGSGPYLELAGPVTVYLPVRRRQLTRSL